MSQDDVERVARALAAQWRERVKDPNWPGDLLASEFDDLARAALSALPERELLAEALDALEHLVNSSDYLVNTEGSRRSNWMGARKDFDDALIKSRTTIAKLQAQFGSS
jgi:hypothetical protein